MLDAIIGSVPKVMGIVGTVVDGLTGTDGALSGLLPVFVVGCAMTFFGWAFGQIRSITPGA